MEQIKPEMGKNKKGEEVYMLKPNELAELVQRAMKAGQAGSAASSGAPVTVQKQEG